MSDLSNLDNSGFCQRCIFGIGRHAEGCEKEEQLSLCLEQEPSVPEPYKAYYRVVKGMTQEQVAESQRIVEDIMAGKAILGRPKGELR